MTALVTIRIQEQDFDIAREIAALSHDRTDIGAVVSFSGICRGSEGQDAIDALTLEHYPGMAEAEIARHANEAMARWPLNGLTIIHRTGRITPGEAAGFGFTLAVFSVVSLGLLVNVLAAALLAFTIFFYVVIYTIWLKRSTPQNIVIGGAAGALPPVIGWAAATGSLALEPLVLFLIVFLWTPPHFWALSLYRTDDYVRAGVPMLPVVAGAAETRRQIFRYTLVLTPVGVAPWLLGYTGAVYGITAALAGAAMIALAIRVRGETRGHAACKQMFGFSILYLFLLFAMLLVDRMSGGLFGHFTA